MKKLLIMCLAALCGSTYAMDLSEGMSHLPTKTTRTLSQNTAPIATKQKALDLKLGDTTTWHTRTYCIVEKTDTKAEVTLVMSRPIHKICGLPLATEYVTRRFSAHNNWAEETSSQLGASPYIVSLTTSTLLLSLLSAYALGR